MKAAAWNGLATVAEAVDALRAGRMVIVVDDADRENEGDLVLAADHVSAEAVNFMATFGRGLICVPMLTETLDALQIPPAVAHNTDPKGTAFRVSVDHARLTTTGISATDRANTIRALINSTSTPTDFTRPGHVFPLGYTEGGVLARPGHTEAAVDLAALAGLTPAGVICEVCSSDGEMARMPELMKIGETHGLPVLTIADLITYRRSEVCRVKRAGEARLPLASGTVRAVGFVDGANREHIALVVGALDQARVPLVGIHSERLVSDVFGWGHDHVEWCLARIAEYGDGVVIYSRNSTMKALTAPGFDCSVDELDERVAGEILTNLGVDQFQLMMRDQCTADSYAHPA